MKKKLMIVAAAAIATGTQAQSSVTLFGVIDAAVLYARADGNGHVTRLVNSSNASSRLGFRGVEDPGGGLSASFWLEAAVNNDNGTGAATNTNNQTSGGGVPTAGGQGLTFNRRSTVSLSGPFGEIRLGRDYVPSFLNLPIFDPFGTNGVANSLPLTAVLGLTTGPQTAVRASNSIGYILPGNLGGFYGQAMYALGENASNATAASDGRHLGLRLGYASGPFNVAAASGRTRLAAGDYVQTTLGASYKAAFATFFGQLNDESRKSAAQARSRSWLLGVLVPVGPHEFKASLVSVNQNAAAGDNDARQLGLGYVYNFSKRTAAYVHYARADNRHGVAYNNGLATTVSGGNTSGLEFGLRHSF